MQIFLAILTAAAVVALILVWRLTPLSSLADPDTLMSAMVSISALPWSPAVVLASYLAAGLVAFPVALLIVATAAAFGPWLGLLYSVVGLMASATLTYAVGRWAGRELTQRVLGSRLDFLKRRGVLAVAIARAVPATPFAVISLAGGASGIRLLDYLIGTALGILPGLLLLSALGHQIFRALADPSLLQLALLAAAAAIWIAAAISAQILAARLGMRRT